MFIPSVSIDRDAFVTDLVKKNYRTAAIFRKYGIEFCCAPRFPLSVVCDNLGIDFEVLQQELKNASQPMQLPPNLQYEEWDIDFLVDYIINVHHRYIMERLPFIEDQLDRFLHEHEKKQPELIELQEKVRLLASHLYPHLRQEEEVLFPYVRQIAHAFADSEPYAGLLVRTLRKPVEDIMNREHDLLLDTLRHIRLLTHNYKTPEGACVSHRVTFSFLHELDNDLIQHLHLESGILFPRAIAMEKELRER